MLLPSRADSYPGQDPGLWPHTRHPLSQETELKHERQDGSSSGTEAISCTQVNCTCDGFQPGKLNLRSCDRCLHGWVIHAVSKLGSGPALGSGQVEMVQPPVVFDICSVLLYGTQAVPIRMKILLDRLFSVLTHTQVLAILHTLGWTLRDYIRGYILQDSVGKVLDRWVTLTLEDEVVALQQFMRFGETKSIVELMVAQEQQGRLATISRATRTDSDIRLFIESSSPHCRSQICVGEGGHRLRGQIPPSLHHFENLAGGNLDFLQPFQYSSTSTPPPLFPLSVLLHETSACRPWQPRQTKQNHGTDSKETEAAPANSSGRKTPTVGRSTGEDRRGGAMRAEEDRRGGAIRPGEDRRGGAMRAGEDRRGGAIRPGEDRRGGAMRPGEDRRGGAMRAGEDRRGGAMRADGELEHGASMTSNNLQCINDTKTQGPLANGETPDPCSSSPSSSSATWVRSPGSSMRKGRVSCGACGKTFYDKGTLKIHYNAVHLKIKHRCTIQGCSMVFSSLRSRNRHSANPNPRLHAPTLQPPTPPSRATPPLGTSPPRMPASILEVPHTPLIFPCVTSVEPSSEIVLSARSPPDLIINTANDAAVTDQQLEKLYACIHGCNGAPAPKGTTMSPLTVNQSRFLTMTDTMPKRKSRKSSMPVKIKRETPSEQDSQDNRSHDNGSHDNDYDKEDTDEEAAHHEGGGTKVYFINGLMTARPSSLALTQRHSTLSDTHIHQYGSSTGSCSRKPHQGENANRVLTGRNVPHPPGTMGNHGYGNGGNMEELGTSEKNEGVMEKRMKGTGYEREENNWRERKRRERGQPLIKVKEEVSDPSYDMYCNEHHDVNSRAAMETVAMTSANSSNSETGFNTNSNKEEEDEKDEDRGSSRHSRRTGPRSNDDTQRCAFPHVR